MFNDIYNYYGKKRKNILDKSNQAISKLYNDTILNYSKLNNTSAKVGTSGTKEDIKYYLDGLKQQEINKINDEAQTDLLENNQDKDKSIDDAIIKKNKKNQNKPDIMKTAFSYIFKYFA
ncbi:hypothetical protein ABSA28_00963 [Candidatus Hepatincolaceae symbiont of Richtersius coronifer]